MQISKFSQCTIYLYFSLDLVYIILFSWFLPGIAVLVESSNEQNLGHHQKSLNSIIYPICILAKCDNAAIDLCKLNILQHKNESFQTYILPVYVLLPLQLHIQKAPSRHTLPHRIQLGTWYGVRMLAQIFIDCETNFNMQNISISAPLPESLKSFPFIYIAVVIIGVLENFAVLLVTYCNRNLQTASNLFISNLAMSDLLVVGFYIPGTLAAKNFNCKLELRFHL